MREKLQYVQHQNAGLLADLGKLDAALLTQREALASAKAARLACSARADRLCGSSTAVLNPVLRTDLAVCALRGQSVSCAWQVQQQQQQQEQKLCVQSSATAVPPPVRVLHAASPIQQVPALTGSRTANQVTGLG